MARKKSKRNSPRKRKRTRRHNAKNTLIVSQAGGGFDFHGFIQRKFKPREWHFWNPMDGKYNYCGPFTRLDKRLARGDKGINELDEICKQHDIAYRDAKGDKKKKLAADKKMIEALKAKGKKKTWSEAFIQKVMQAKHGLGG